MAKCVVNRKDNGDISVLVENLRHPESIARHRNGGYDFDKAPNGSNSELYDSLTKELGLSDVEARSVIIDIYSDGFGDTHGVWWNDPSVLRLDSNGQPKLYYDKGNLAGKKFLSTEFGGNSAGFLKVSDTDTKVFEPLSISVLSESDSDSITLLNGGQEEVLLKNSYDFINIRSTESLSKGNLLPDLKLIGNILVEKGLVSSVNFGTSDEIKQEIQKINDRNRLKTVDGKALSGFDTEVNGGQGLYPSGELGENNSGTEQGNEGGRIRINYHLVPIREVSEAENLEKEGVSDLDIKKKTGLEKGSDGVWRLELDRGELDISEKGRTESDDLVGNVVSYRLGDIYNQQDLFYLIQGLDDIKVYTYEESKGNEFSSREGFTKGNSIYIKRRDIQRRDFTSRKEKEDFEKVLVHEIQHLIQRVTNTPYGTSFVIESDKVLNTLNGLKENRDFVSKEYSNRLIDNISNRTGLRSDEVLNRIDDVLKDGDLMYDISFDMYEQAHGEVEARNASNRISIPIEDRFQTLYKDSQDIKNPLLKYHLVPVSDSSKAEELEKQGLSELGIKRQTGIERGRDGIWRKEIPTKDIDLSESKFKRVWHGDFDILEEADLTDIYNNEDLYKEFPQLKNTVVYLYDGFKHDPEDSNEGFQYGGHIFINKRRNREDKSRRKHILFHEIQHLIQRASGTSGGANFDRMLGEIESRYSGLDKDTGGDTLFTRVLDEHVKDVTKSKYDSFSKLPSSEFNRIKRALAQRMYDSKYGEIEAETAARRGLYPNQDLRNVTLFKDVDRYIEQGVWYSDSDLKYHLVPVEDSSSAEELEKQGLNELDIKNRTGLERGRDGIWRKEIGVGKFDFNAEGTLTEDPKFIGKVKLYKLGDIYDNQELYKNYPFLEKADVVYYEKGNNEIFDNIDGFQYEGGIFINNSKSRKTTPEDVILHEIQHIIQRTEGSTAGTTFEWEKERVFMEFENGYNETGGGTWYQRVFRRHLLDIFKGKESSVKFLFTQEGKAYRDYVVDALAQRMYESKYGEVEARNASYRSRYMTDFERRNSLYKDTETSVENGVWFDSDLVDDVDYSKNSSINGFYDPRTRQIWVNKDNPEKLLGTTFHELSHPYLDYLELTNSELFNAGIKLLEGKKSEAKYYFDRVDRNYPGLSESEYYKEVLAEMIADEGRNIADRKLKKDFLNWLSEFFQELGKVLGFSRLTPRKVANMSLNEMTQSMLSDMFDSSNQGLRLGQRYGIGTSYDTEVLARFRFDLPNLKKISQGSDRVVYDLGNGMVLKVAKTARGFAQNSVERDWYLSDNGLLPELYETGLNYNVMRKVEPLKKTDMVQTYDVDGNELGKVKVSEMFKDFATITQVDVDSYDESYQAVLYKYGLIDYMNYNMMWGDVKRIKNWGRDGENVVHIDGGTFNSDILKESRIQLEEEDFRQAYEESKRLKKLFKDSDKNTKFSIDNYNNRQIEFAIERNNGNELNLAPNGNPSNAYAQLKDSGLSDHKVYEILSEMYTDSFIENFGDWINGESTNLLLDNNGQPMVIWKGINSGDTKVDHKLGNNHFGNENFRTAMNYAYGFDTSSPSMRRRLNKFISTSDTVVKPVLVYGNGIAELDLNDGFGADQVMRENPEVDVVVGSSQNQSGNAYAVRDTEQFVDLSDNLLADIIGLDNDSEGVKFSLDSEESTSIVSDNSGTIDNELDRYVQSPVYEELKSIPGITPEQALDIYKHIYSTELIDWKDMDRTC